MPGTTFIVSDLLELNATEDERSKGLDIADYLLKFDIKAFHNKEIIEPLEPISILIDQIL